MLFIVLGSVAVLVGGYFLAKPLPPQLGRKRRSSVDTALMARGPFPTEQNNPNTLIIKILAFDDMPSLDDFRETLKKDVVDPNFRYRAVPVADSKAVIWTEVDSVDYSKHITTVTVSSAEEMDAEINRIVQTRELGVPDTAPRWEARGIFGSEDCQPSTKTGSNYSGYWIIRQEHAIGDGLALVKALQNFARTKEGAPFKVAFDPSDRKPKGFSLQSLLALPLNLLKWTIIALRVLTIGMIGQDSRTKFGNWSGPWNSKNQVLVRLPPFPLQTVKRIKAHHKCSVNDVLYSCWAGAIQAYLEKVGDKLANSKKLSMRAVLPVAFPRVGKKGDELHNRFVMTSCRLPVVSNNRLSRLQETIQIMNGLKTSGAPLVQRLIQNIVGRLLPIAMQRDTTNQFFVRHTTVFSNVPGPQEPLYVAGKEIKSAWVCYPNAIPQVIIISYNGLVYMTYVVDKEKIPDPKVLQTLFMAELEALDQA